MRHYYVFSWRVSQLNVQYVGAERPVLLFYSAVRAGLYPCYVHCVPRNVTRCFPGQKHSQCNKSAQLYRDELLLRPDFGCHADWEIGETRVFVALEITLFTPCVKRVNIMCIVSIRNNEEWQLYIHTSYLSQNNILWPQFPSSSTSTSSWNIVTKFSGVSLKKNVKNSLNYQ